MREPTIPESPRRARGRPKAWGSTGAVGGGVERVERGGNEGVGEYGPITRVDALEWQVTGCYLEPDCKKHLVWRCSTTTDPAT